MIAKVIISRQAAEIDEVYEYTVPEDMQVCAGIRALVPFGRGNAEAVVLSVSDDATYDGKLKPITRLLDARPLLTEGLLKLAEYIKERYLCTHYAALRLCMPAGIRIKPHDKLEKSIAVYSIASDDLPQVNAAVQHKVLQHISDRGECTVPELEKTIKGARAAVAALVKRGILQQGVRRISRFAYDINAIAEKPAPPLTDEQQAAFDGITQCSGTPNALIYGITGSGKTEVYMRLISRYIAEGKQAIVLVPEISLTPQAVERFAGRFGSVVSVLHSGLSVGEKYDEWERILNGEVCVVVGARSAVFAPLSNLGIIIVDEEHETTYRSDSAPEYDAIDVARFRCENEGAALVLGSATPSIRTYYAAINGNLQLFTMEKRINQAALPAIKIADMRQELSAGNKSIFSRLLIEEINANLTRGEQTILFLNKRGFHSSVVCRTCGEPVRCRHCEVPLTYHKYSESLQCHFCGYFMPNVTLCPKCGSKYIRYMGTGTERVEQDLTALFPSARYIRMDSDTTSRKNSHRDMLRRFEQGAADILIGTQMVIKGLDYPNVTLSAVLNADLTLNMDDYRAGERCFAQLIQLSGRAGRADKIGRAVIQTYQPSHYVISFAKQHDYVDFYQNEIALRERLYYPPFCDILYFLSQDKDEAAAKSALEQVISFFKRYVVAHNINAMLLNPSPCPYSKIKDKYRYRAIIKINDAYSLSEAIRDILKQHGRGIVTASVNPTNMN